MVKLTIASTILTVLIEIMTAANVWKSCGRRKAGVP
jgi:hypothetical protein